MKCHAVTWETPWLPLSEGAKGELQYMSLLMFRLVAAGVLLGPGRNSKTEMRSIPKELGAFGAMRRKALRSV